MTEFNFVGDSIAIPRKRTNPVLWEFAEALRARSGQWAEYPLPIESDTYRNNIASRISNRNRLAPKPFRDGFEATSAGGRLYVRHIGGES